MTDTANQKMTNEKECPIKVAGDRRDDDEHDTDGAGKFYLINVQTGTVLDVRRSDPNPGAEVIAHTKNPVKTANQLWYLDDGKFLRSALNNYAIAEDAKIPGGGHRISMQPYMGQPEGQWIYDDQKIINVASKEVIGISEVIASGSALISSQYIELDTQLWKRQYVPIV